MASLALVRPGGIGGLNVRPPRARACASTPQLLTASGASAAGIEEKSSVAMSARALRFPNSARLPQRRARSSPKWRPAPAACAPRRAAAAARANRRVGSCRTPCPTRFAPRRAARALPRVASFDVARDLPREIQRRDACHIATRPRQCLRGTAARARFARNRACARHHGRGEVLAMHPASPRDPDQVQSRGHQDDPGEGFMNAQGKIA